MVRTGRRVVATLLAACVTPLPAAAGDLPVLDARLPAAPLACPLSGETSSVREIADGRPLALLFFTPGTDPGGPLFHSVADLQAEFAPWLLWVGVLAGEEEGSGDGRAVDFDASPVRFDYCFHDRDSLWTGALGMGALPRLVLANEDCFVVATLGLAEGGASAAPLLDRLVRSSRLAGAEVRDFNFPEVGTGRLLSLADVARRDITLFFSLGTSCAGCVSELRLLEVLRDRHRDRLGLVAVFQDALPPERVAAFIGKNRLNPDFALRDPRRYLLRDYPVGAVPALVASDAAGRIFFVRSGFDLSDSRGFFRALERAVEVQLARPRPPTAFAEARRVRDGGLAYLREGRPAMGALYLERSLEIDPRLFTVNGLLAESYLTLGHPAEAAACLRRYLERSPSAYDLPQVAERLRAVEDALH